MAVREITVIMCTVHTRRCPFKRSSFLCTMWYLFRRCWNCSRGPHRMAVVVLAVVGQIAFPTGTRFVFRIDRHHIVVFVERCHRDGTDQRIHAVHFPVPRLSPTPIVGRPVPLEKKSSGKQRQHYIRSRELPGIVAVIIGIGNKD